MSLSRATILAIRELHHKAGREAQQKLLVEGRHAVEGALQGQLALDHLYVRHDAQALLNVFGTHQYTTVSPDDMSRLATTDSPPPVLGVFRRPVPPNAAALMASQVSQSVAPLWLLLDGVRDPGNLGTILRCAQAFEVSAVWLSDDSVDPEHPKVIRASAGIGFLLPVVCERHMGWDTLCQALASHQFGSAYATSATGQAQPYTAIDWQGRWALMMGAEATGVRTAWAADMATAVTIPMSPLAESLNVAVSTGILLADAFGKRTARITASQEGG
jgi:TrmH family RNA methyltransferase